nr:MAG TPA: conotoxin [Caudoviricetes sp.]
MISRCARGKCKSAYGFYGSIKRANSRSLF